jgi:hypothetical protein
LEEFNLLVKTIAFEKLFFQYNPETNDKICNVEKHIFCDNFQNCDYLLFNMNTGIHYKLFLQNECSTFSLMTGTIVHPLRTGSFAGHADISS